MKKQTIISIVNQKGGTGKTTTVLNLGAALVRQKKKVLVIDSDPQGNLTYSLGLQDSTPTLGDLLLGEVTWGEVIKNSEGMEVIPADVSLVDAEISLTNVIGRELILKKILNKVKGYDYVLVDCPPSLSLLTLNALCASDKVVIPLQLEVLSLQGLDKILNTIGQIREVFNPELSIEGVLPVMVDQRKNLTKEINSFLTSNYEVKVFQSSIRTNVKASESPSFGKSVIAYAPGSNSAVDYLNFAKELVQVNR